MNYLGDHALLGHDACIVDETMQRQLQIVKFLLLYSVLVHTTRIRQFKDMHLLERTYALRQSYTNPIVEQ